MSDSIPEHFRRFISPPNLPRINYEEIFEATQRARDEHTSMGVFNHLVVEIKKFDESLNNDFEVGVMLASFGQAILIKVRWIGFIYPKLIIFEGFLDDENEDNNARLIQHVNQLNFLLVKMKRKDPSTPKRPIGFGPVEEESGEEKKNEA